MWLRWFPWRQLVSRLARSRGLIDPVQVLSRLESLAQPLELKEPLELLRAGMVLHARGLLNAGAIQHNLDWVWPYWVERQYDPTDVSFVPRAFSLTHINLTHRNWTAIGLPDCDEIPLVDPRGLLTPFWDGWSLDVWLVGTDGASLIPSRHDRVEQRLELEAGVAVVTESNGGTMHLRCRAEVEAIDGLPTCALRLRAESGQPGWLVVSLRPYNPEGVSFVRKIEREAGGRGWRVDDRRRVRFERPPDGWAFSDYRGGDVRHRLHAAETAAPGGVSCGVGLATAAALFALERGVPATLRVEVPLAERKRRPAQAAAVDWMTALGAYCRLAVPDARVAALYDAAVRSLVLHSPGEVYPGPYTYKRFWFRDCAFILHGLLCAGFVDRVERVLDTFPGRQTRAGFFLSQQNEWDSNGEALWILWRFCELTGRAPKPEWRAAIRRGARWIMAKRLPDEPAGPHAGLLPPGFSAEHLGPNDYYYWDDFWSAGGLRAAARLLAAAGEAASARALEDEAGRLLGAIDRSLAGAAARLGRPAMPASPYRRLDSGAVGSLAGGYPLQLLAPRDERLLDTAAYLLDHCFVDGCFFQDVIHSGLNPYLTLHVAEVLLRAGDGRALALMQEVARRATSTGQWPEAIHPRTGGGCMGDGHHVWAAAEWLLFVRNAFVREEGDGLVLASGVPASWLEPGTPVLLGPTPTSFGPLSVRLEVERAEAPEAAAARPGRAARVRVGWEAQWRAAPPPIEVRLPGRPPLPVPAGRTSVVVECPRAP